MPDFFPSAPAVGAALARAFEGTTPLADALHQSPGSPVLLRYPVRAQARFRPGRALAYTVTHVLMEYGEGSDSSYHWEPGCLVRRTPRGP